MIDKKISIILELIHLKNEILWVNKKNQLAILMDAQLYSTDLTS